MTKNENSSQFEILHHDNSIEYSREGGYFVTYKKAIIYLTITVLLSVTVGIIVYRYGPRTNWQEVVPKEENIQDLLDKSIRNTPIQSVKLPDDVKPLHYKLSIQPDVEHLTFSGEVFITLESFVKTKYIVLNVDRLSLHNISIHQLHNERRRRAVEQNIPPSSSNTTQNVASNQTKSVENSTQTPNNATEDDHIQVIRNDEKSEQITKLSGNIHVISGKLNKENQQYILHLSSHLLPGNKYTLEIAFDGNISESLQGLHENSYVTNDGNKKYIIASHLQPTFARRVFPCFDDPSLQATFEITIIHKDNMNCLSNMPLKNTTNLGDGWIKDQFETSPVMPPFLVAMILLDKQYYSSISGNQNISIWAPKEHLKYASFPLEKTQKILSYYIKHFNMPYPLPKLDIVTIPTLPSTATENWGLILFKESTLLNGEDEREIFSFLAKKIAQQWFGNLVSIKWWNDLWLVKGFALLEADDASIEINNWNSDFTLRIMQKMLALDDFTPITLERNITNILDINQLYDSVTHYKGSCLLRMLEHSISESAFENGTQYFLNRWKYGVVDQKQFWTSIGNIVRNYLPQGKNIASIMDTWSSQSGYPLITVTRNRKTSSIEISQSKFQATNESDNSLWIVPLNYIIGNGDERKLWLTDRSITVANVSSDKWILFNVKRTGYYRVNYDNDNWNMLIKAINEDHKAIPIENRGQLINDAFQLAQNSLLNYEIPFNLTRYLHKEDRYVPWASAMESLSFIKDILKSTYLNGAYEEYIKNLVSPLYDKMQNVTDGHQLLRKLIIETSCSVNYEPCADWATNLFRQWMENNITLPYDLRRTIFCTAIKAGGKEEWDYLWGQIRLQKTNNDIEELFMSLGCSRDTWLINKYMRNSHSGTIPWQFVPYVWQSLGQPTSVAFGFKYLRENWDEIYEAYKDKPIILKAIIQDFLYGLGTKSDLEDLTILVSKHEQDFQQLASLVQGAVDRIKVRVDWSNKHLSQIENLLSN